MLKTQRARGSGAPTPDPVHGGDSRQRVKHPTIRAESITRALFIAPALAYMVVFFAYPLVQNLLMSVREYTEMTYVTGEAPFVGLEKYTEMVTGYLFMPAFWNTIIFTVGSILGQFSIGLALASFFKRHFPLGSVLRALLLLPWLIPLIVSSAVWRSLMERDSGIINRFLEATGLIDAQPWLTSPDMALYSVILVNIWVGIPFNVAILYGGLQDIPDELYEAGAVDGAVGWKAFWHITWPNLRPVVGVVLILGVVYTIRVLDLILGLTQGGPANSTQTLAIRAYQESFVNFDFGVGAAYSNVLILVALAFALLYLRANRRAVDE